MPNARHRVTLGCPDPSFWNHFYNGPSENDEAASPWQDTHIDLRFLDEKINADNCSRSDRNLLSVTVKNVVSFA